MKSITIYHIDGVKTLDALIQKAREEFPGIPFGEIKVTFGYVSVCLEAETNKPRSRMRRIFKAQI